MESFTIIPQDLQEISTEDWEFLSVNEANQLPLVKPYQTPDQLPIKLFALAQTKDLFVAAGQDGIKTGKLSLLRHAALGSSEQSHSGFSPIAIPYPSRISQLTFSSDENYLVVVCDNSLLIQVFSVQGLLNGDLGQPVNEIRTDSPILDYRSRPLNGTQAAVLLHNGNLSIFNRLDNQLTQIANEISGCDWSPLGKQLLVGKFDGSLAQITDGGVLKVIIDRPPNIPVNTCRPITIQWLSNHVFLLIYRDSQSSDSFDQDNPPFRAFVVKRDTKALTYTWSRINDPCPSFIDAAPQTCWLPDAITNWNPELPYLITLNASHSPNVSLLTESASFMLLNETRRAELPLSESDPDLEVLPLGSALDISSTENVDSPCMGVEVSPALPILWNLSNEGNLSGWHIVWTHKLRSGDQLSLETASNDLKIKVAKAAQEQSNTSSVSSPQASKPAFGSSNFGSISSTPSSTFANPSFGSSNSAFGNSSFGSGIPTFGQSSFGQPSPAFGQSSFGQTPPAFGQSSFGSSAAPSSFGATPGSSSANAFGSSGFDAIAARTNSSFDNTVKPAPEISIPSSGGFARFASAGSAGGFAAFTSGQSTGLFGSSDQPQGSFLQSSSNSQFGSFGLGAVSGNQGRITNVDSDDEDVAGSGEIDVDGDENEDDMDTNDTQFRDQPPFSQGADLSDIIEPMATSMDLKDTEEPESLVSRPEQEYVSEPQGSSGSESAILVGSNEHSSDDGFEHVGEHHAEPDTQAEPHQELPEVSQAHVAPVDMRGESTGEEHTLEEAQEDAGRNVPTYNEPSVEEAQEHAGRDVPTNDEPSIEEAQEHAGRDVPTDDEHSVEEAQEDAESDVPTYDEHSAAEAQEDSEEGVSSVQSSSSLAAEDSRVNQDIEALSLDEGSSDWESVASISDNENDAVVKEDSEIEDAEKDEPSPSESFNSKESAVSNIVPSLLPSTDEKTTSPSVTSSVPSSLPTFTPTAKDLPPDDAPDTSDLPKSEPSVIVESTTKESSPLVSERVPSRAPTPESLSVSEAASTPVESEISISVGSPNIHDFSHSDLSNKLLQHLFSQYFDIPDFVSIQDAVITPVDTEKEWNEFERIFAETQLSFKVVSNKTFTKLFLTVIFLFV